MSWLGRSVGMLCFHFHCPHVKAPRCQRRLRVRATGFGCTGCGMRRLAGAMGSSSIGHMAAWQVRWVWARSGVVGRACGCGWCALLYVRQVLVEKSAGSNLQFWVQQVHQGHRCDGFGFGQVQQAGGCGRFGFGQVRSGSAGWQVRRVRVRSGSIGFGRSAGRRVCGGCTRRFGAPALFSRGRSRSARWG